MQKWACYVLHPTGQNPASPMLLGALLGRGTTGNQADSVSALPDPAGSGILRERRLGGCLGGPCTSEAEVASLMAVSGWEICPHAGLLYPAPRLLGTQSRVLPCLGKPETVPLTRACPDY